MVGKLTPSSSGDYVLIDCYAGTPDNLQHAGTLRLTVGEWQLIGAALLIGAGQTNGHLQVQIDGPVRNAAAAGLPIPGPSKADGIIDSLNEIDRILDEGRP